MRNVSHEPTPSILWNLLRGSSVFLTHHVFEPCSSLKNPPCSKRHCSSLILHRQLVIFSAVSSLRKGPLDRSQPCPMTATTSEATITAHHFANSPSNLTTPPEGYFDLTAAGRAAALIGAKETDGPSEPQLAHLMSHHDNMEVIAEDLKPTSKPAFIDALGQERSVESLEPPEALNILQIHQDSKMEEMVSHCPAAESTAAPIPQTQEDGHSCEPFRQVHDEPMQQDIHPPLEIQKDMTSGNSNKMVCESPTAGTHEPTTVEEIGPVVCVTTPTLSLTYSVQEPRRLTTPPCTRSSPPAVGARFPSREEFKKACQRHALSLSACDPAKKFHFATR